MFRAWARTARSLSRSSRSAQHRSLKPSTFHKSRHRPRPIKRNAKYILMGGVVVNVKLYLDKFSNYLLTPWSNTFDEAACISKRNEQFAKHADSVKKDIPENLSDPVYERYKGFRTNIFGKFKTKNDIKMNMRTTKLPAESLDALCTRIDTYIDGQEEEMDVEYIAKGISNTLRFTLCLLYQYH